ncbi:MAG TPA: hypothetical protein VG407_05575 [Caulobacteraceae bacterium]|jgi:hypothetical protein|nr:hypothetical protein [Caulobacteraceae bacterium]
MAATAALFVSKRLQLVTAAFLCLMAVQLVLSSSSREPANYPVSTRVAISR